MSEENERLYEETQRWLREVTTLYEASQACLSISDQKGLLTAIIEAAARATDAVLGSVMLVDEKKGEYVFGAHYGLSEETIAAVEAELHIPLGEGLVGSVVTTGQPVVVADVTTDPRWIPTETKELMRSFLGVPLVGKDGQPLGALNLSRSGVGAFDEDHARLLSTFANQAAMAIENARLYERAQQEIVERKRAEESLRRAHDELEIWVQERTTALAKVNQVLQAEITERKRAEEALRKAHDEMERQVEERTAELVIANEQLKREIEERKRAEEERERRSRELAMLNEICRAVTSSLDFSEVLALLLDRARQGLGAEACSVALLDDNGDLVFHHAEGEGAEAVIGLRLKPGQGIGGWVAQSGQSALVPDAHADPHFYGEVAPGFTTRDMVCAPLVVRDEIIGVVELLNKGQGTFAEDDVRVLESVATQAATAIENARLYEQTKRRLNELSLLNEVALISASTLDFDEILRGTVESLHRRLELEVFGFLIVDEEAGELRLHPTYLGIPPESKDFRIPMGEGITGRVAQSGQPLLTPDVSKEPCYLPAIPEIRSEICVPLKVGQKVIGVIDAESTRLNAFSEDDLRLFSTLAGQLALSLESARLYQRARWSEERYRDLFENANDLIFTLDRDFNISDVNKMAEQLTGYSVEEARGMNVSRFLSPKDLERTRLLLADLAGEPVPQPFETEIIRKDGGKVLCEITGRLIEKEGKPVGVHCIARDVTERKRAEEYLRESEERFRQMAELSPFPVSIIDPAGRYEYVNPKFIEVFGYTLEDVPNGKEWFTRSYPDPAYRQEAISAWLSDLEQFGEYEVRPRTFSVTCRDGTVREIVFRSVTMKDGRQFVIYEDITERKRAEEQLRQAQKMEAIGQLAGGLAHDFNNLLTPIGGFAEFLMWKTAEDSQQYEYLRQIKGGAERAAALTSQLLTLARRAQVEVRPLSLNDIVHEVIGLLERTIDKAIAIEPHLADDLATVEGDAGQLHQVLLNLCLNARDAMPQSGRLIIGTQNVTLSEAKARTELDLEAGQYVLLNVTDTGSGMDAETQQRIFEPFFTTKEEGRGLGLAMVYGIVRGHGGAIHVYSELGRGSTFKVYLPAASRPAEDIAPGEAEAVGGIETVLVVDDEEPVRALLQRILEEGGYTVLLATDGVEATELYAERGTEIDLVVLDIIMPRMGGRETYERLREINPEVKVLLSSGYTKKGQAQDILAAGARGFLPKPYDLRAVLRKVRGVLES